MPNLPGPYELEFGIRIPSTPNREHVMRFNCIATGSPSLGTPLASINFMRRSGTTVAGDVGMNLLWSFIRIAFNTSATCFSVILWRYASGTRSKDFVTASTPTTPAGSSATAFVAKQQVTASFRSANGGVQKIVYLEPSLTGEARATLIANAAGDAIQKMASYIMSADNITLSADDAFAIAPLRDSRGENEHIFKKINRA